MIRIFKACRGARIEVDAANMARGDFLRIVNCEERENLREFWLRPKNFTEVVTQGAKLFQQVHPNSNLLASYPELSEMRIIKVNGEEVSMPHVQIATELKIIRGRAKGETKRLCPTCAKYYANFYDVEIVKENL